MMPCWVGFAYGVGAHNSASAPARASRTARPAAVSVAGALHPATTGTRPRDVTVARRTSAACSSGCIAAASPVLPQTIRAVVPRTIWRSQRWTKAALSMARLRNGVIIAVIEAPRARDVRVMTTSGSRQRQDGDFGAAVR